jgi:hypothetical protein
MGMAADTDQAPRCPDCGNRIEHWDLPCQSCGTPAEQLLALHQFSKTLKNEHRHLFQNHPERFVEEVNAWLRSEPGIWGLRYVMTRDRNLVVNAITFTCDASLRPAPGHFSMSRIVLVRGPLMSRRTDPGVALNAWREAHPHRQMVTHSLLSSGGVATELWVLAFQRRMLSAAQSW